MRLPTLCAVCAHMLLMSPRVRMQFAVTLGPVPSRDARCCVFGRLIRGYGLLRELERLPLRSGAPLQPVRVAICTPCSEHTAGGMLLCSAQRQPAVIPLHTPAVVAPHEHISSRQSKKRT